MPTMKTYGRLEGFSTFIGAAIIALLAALTLVPVALGQGWPMNHEFNLPWNFNSFYLRTLVYAEHMQQGDWFPIWSAADNDGFGSPQPLMYHKLFYLLSGALFALTGHLKASILLSLWGFLVVGATGTYALCRTLACSPALSWAGGLLLLIANYTITNWLIRGAMAEFAAAMLVPWVLQAFVGWLQNDDRQTARLSLLGFFLGLEFLAHSVLAFYLVLLLATTVLALVALRKFPLSRLRVLPIIFSALVFGLITGPYLAAMHLFSPDYDMGRIIPPPFLPENQIKPIMSYIWDSQWHWGTAWDRYTVQLDLPTLLLLAVGALAWAASRLIQQLKAAAAVRLTPPSIGLVALVIIGALCVALQTVWAVPFYQKVPGAAFIQFPWRLLGVITPCLIAVAIAIWQRLNQTLAVIATGLCIVIALFLCGAWVPVQYGSTPSYTAHLDGFRFGAFGEYIPRSAGTEVLYNLPALQAMVAARQCALTARPSDSPEALVKHYTLNCEQPGTYPLPLFASPLHRVLVTDAKENGTTSTGCAVDEATPGLCAVMLTAPGAYEIRVVLPTIAGWATRRL
jgi:hypothetical protein